MSELLAAVERVRAAVKALDAAKARDVAAWIETGVSRQGLADAGDEYHRARKALINAAVGETVEAES